MEKCKFCKNNFSNKHTLLQHQKNTKYCLKIQGKKNDTFKCTFCIKTYSTRQNLEIHYSKCKKSVAKNISTHNLKMEDFIRPYLL